MKTELVVCRGCGQELALENCSRDMEYECPNCSANLNLWPENRVRSGSVSSESHGVSKRKLRCAHHPNAAAIRRCEICGNTLCSTCVINRYVNHDKVEVCPCGGRVERLTPVERGFSHKPVTFQNTLATAFSYPFLGQGAVMMLLGTIFFSGVSYLFAVPILGWGFLFLTLAYVTAFMTKIIFSSAMGADEPPEWPEMARMWESIFQPFLLVGLVGAFCAGPAAAYLYFFEAADPVFWALATVGAAFFPMGLACVAVTGTPVALNPILWLNAILKVPGDYFLACFVFFTACGLKAAGEGISSQIPYVGCVVGTFFLLYFLMVEMRVLGLIFLMNQDRIDWN